MGIFDRMKPHTKRQGADAARVTELAAALDFARHQLAARRFDGAIVDRLTASWKATNVAIDEELRRDLDKLRARSRDLAKNNEHAAKFSRMVRNNIVGPEGFSLHPRAIKPDGKLDTADNQAISDAFWDWCQPRHCHVGGRLAFADLCRLVATTWAIDGECLIRRMRGVGKYGYQLQPINTDRLDTTYNRAATANQNAIVMGVEVDSDHRPVAYYLWTAPPSLVASRTRTRERVPAADIIHLFIQLEPEQTRGVPWMHAAMRILNDLKGYREAAVIAARIGASKMGLWVTPDGGPPPGTDPNDTEDRAPLTDVAPGQFDYAPNGYTFKEFNPTYPHDQFDAFCKATLRGVSSAWGVSYNKLNNDLEGVNYSSLRGGEIDERDEWIVLQNTMINQFLSLLYPDWLEQALIRGMIRGPGGSALPATKLDKFSAHLWQGRRWQWVDPEKDINAAVIAIANRLASPQQIAMQTGRDIEDILEDFVAYGAMCKAKGLEVPNFGASPSPPAPAPKTTTG